MQKTMIILFLLLPMTLLGAISSDGQSEKLLTTFSSAADHWVAAIKPAAQYLFWSFVTIDIVITFGFLAIKGTQIGEIFGELIRKVLWIGFFLFLFQTANLLDTIPASFDKLAQSGSGIDIQPDVVLEQAIDLVLKMWESLDFSIDSLVMVFAGIICLIAFALMAAQLFVVLVKIQALIAGAYLVFAFGGLSYTRNMAINPLKAIFGAGMELMFIKLFMGMTVTTIEDLTANVGNDTTSALTIIVVSILLVSVVRMIPGIVSSLMDGTLGGNSTSGLATAAAVAGGAIAGGVASARSGVGMSKAVSAAKELSAAGQGSTMGNLAKALGADMLKTVSGDNKRDTTSTGNRSAGSMREQAAKLNAQNVKDAAQQSNTGSNDTKGQPDASNYISSVPN